MITKIMETPFKTSLTFIIVKIGIKTGEYSLKTNLYMTWKQSMMLVWLCGPLESEKEALQERIVSLVRGNDCLAARLQEVVSVSRNLSGHMHSVKDQLERVEAEKDNLHRKVK